jgi:hypothetical protein
MALWKVDFAGSGGFDAFNDVARRMKRQMVVIYG